MKKITLALFALFIAVPAYAAETEDNEWLLMGTANNGVVGYARIDDLVVGQPGLTDARVWMKLEIPAKLKTGYTRIVTLYSFNCVERSYRSIQTSAFRVDGSVQDGSRYDGKTEYILPGSNMDGVAKLLCGSAKN